MIPFENALRIVLERARPTGAETVPLAAACGRVLARDAVSDIDMPPFDKSAMDGFACRRADLPGPLAAVRTIVAGAPPGLPLATGQCARIMTGAEVPPGADCVIKIEESRTLAEGRILFTGAATPAHICPRGEDVRAGDAVLRAGTLLEPRHLGLLAAAGCALPWVARRPRVTLLATGDELAPPEAQPGPGQIRDSNTPQLRAQVAAAGAELTACDRVADDPAVLWGALALALTTSDLVLLTGGVSLGDFDFVPRVMREVGIEILFDSVAIKPGKPATFGVGPGGVSCLGLPGNPWAAFVQFELLARPLLYKMMGAEHRHRCWTAPLARTLRRAQTDRAEWRPVTLDEAGRAVPIEHHGSAHLGSLAAAEGLVAIPAGVAVLAEGTLVRVRSI